MVPSSHTVHHPATFFLSGGEYTDRSGQQDGALYPHEDQQAYREHISHRNRNWRLQEILAKREAASASL